jgi:Ulp1 family protease
MGYQLSNLPSIPETVRDIYVPVHMAGSHWGLAYFNLDRRQMVWLDSMEGACMT